MADSLLTQQPTSTPSISRLQEFTNQTGDTNYDATAKRITDAATATRTVHGASSAADRLSQATSAIRGSGTQAYQSKVAGQSLVNELKSSVIPSTQAQAEKAASSLEQKGQSSIESLRRLDAFGDDVALTRERAHQSWETAASQAEEYVATAEMEVATTMKEMTDASESIGKDLDFSKAHDMQVAAQATLGAMNQTENNIAQTYGRDSAEYQQFLGMKSQSLAVAQSQLQADYAKMQTDIDVQMTTNKFTAKAQFQQFVGYNQQNHVNVLSSMAASDAQYAIQETQTLLALEQTRMSINDSLADYLGSTPTFAIDLQPMLMQVNELAAAASIGSGDGGSAWGLGSTPSSWSQGLKADTFKGTGKTA